MGSCTQEIGLMPTPKVIKQAIADLKPVQRLVHLAYRKTEDDVKTIYKALFAQGREAYRNAIIAMAEQLGCTGIKRYQLEPMILSQLSDMYREHAVAIVATYNYDLAHALQTIREQNKFANRHYYAKFLEDWDRNRGDWKNKQIANVTLGWAQNKAVSDFAKFNSLDGVGVFLGPDDSLTCPVCQDLLHNSPYSLDQIQYIECPVHPNCRHQKKIQLADREINCDDLWLGFQQSPTRLSEGLLILKDFSWLDGLNWLQLFEKYGDWLRLGGPGSGNFGHSGRPGLVGGSSSSDILFVEQGLPGFKSGAPTTMGAGDNPEILDKFNSALLKAYNKAKFLYRGTSWGGGLKTLEFLKKEGKLIGGSWITGDRKFVEESDAVSLTISPLVASTFGEEAFTSDSFIFEFRKGALKGDIVPKKYELGSSNRRLWEREVLAKSVKADLQSIERVIIQKVSSSLAPKSVLAEDKRLLDEIAARVKNLYSVKVVSLHKVI